MDAVTVPGCLDTAVRLARQHAATVGAAAVVQLLLIGAVVGLGPHPPSTLALLAYCSLEAAVFLVELGWVWNPGSYTADSYTAMAGLAKLTAVSLAFYGLVATFLLRSSMTGCFLLLMLCYGAREMGHQMLHYSKEAEWRAKAAGSFLGAATVAFSFALLLAYGYVLPSWALMKGRPPADQVLFALMFPLVRLFALLSLQRYLGKQLLEKGLLDALTLYADLSLGLHLAVDLPFLVALLVFSGPISFAVALVLTGLTDVAYVHALAALQPRREDSALVVTFAQQRPASVFAALVGGAFNGTANETSALMTRGPSNASAVTASIGEKDCVRPIGARVAALLDEYQELARRLKAGPRVWAFQELKAAVEAHSVGSWCAVTGALLLLALLPGLRAAAGLSVQACVLRGAALVLVLALADLLRLRELQVQQGEGPLPTAGATPIALGYRVALTAVPMTAVLAAL